MKHTLFSLLFMGAACGAFAGETAAPAPVTEPAASPFSGSVTLGYISNVMRRGIVASHCATEGDSVEFAALKMDYDFGKPGFWSFESATSYSIPTSGHNMFGHPHFGVHMGPLAGLPMPLINMENELMLKNGFRYKQEKWNVAVGHNFFHGGPLGVVAKHYRDQGASCVNEVFVQTEFTPYKWLALGCTTNYSFQGVTGWWFEPYLQFKAPILDTPENVKLAGVVEFGGSMTADYFAAPYNACNNGSQAFFVKLSTPWFVTDRFILTPSVSFNWLGKGGMKANEKSKIRKVTLDHSMVPFRNFCVIGSFAATYKF